MKGDREHAIADFQAALRILPIQESRDALKALGAAEPPPALARAGRARYAEVSVIAHRPVGWLERTDFGLNRAFVPADAGTQRFGQRTELPSQRERTDLVQPRTIMLLASRRGHRHDHVALRHRPRPQSGELPAADAADPAGARGIGVSRPPRDRAWPAAAELPRVLRARRASLPRRCASAASAAATRWRRCSPTRRRCWNATTACRWPAPCSTPSTRGSTPR